jgi:hypothetical protein
MTATERAARDAMKPYVRAHLISQATVNRTIRDGLALVERTVHAEYTADQTFYYAGKIAAAREAYDAQDNPVVRMILGGKLMAAEMFAAVYAVVRAERGDTDLPMEQAVEAMTAVRDTVREMHEETAAPAPPAAVAA